MASKHQPQRVWISALALTVWAGAAGITQASVISTPIVYTGMAAPGTSYTFTNLTDSWGIKGGCIAFVSRTSQNSTTNYGLWTVDPTGTMQLAGYRGLTALNGSTENLATPGTVCVNANGQYAFLNNGTGQVKVAAGDATGLTAFAPPPPGTSAGTGYSQPQRPTIAPDGSVTFRSSLSGSTSGNGLWTNGLGHGLELLGLSGSTLNNYAYDTTFSSYFSANGVILETPTLGGQHSIVMHTAAGAQVVARVTEAATGLSGKTYAGIGDVRMTDHGQYGFTAAVTDGSPATKALYLNTGTGLAPTVLQNDPAPGLTNNLFYDFSNLALSNNGGYAFYGTARVGGTGAKTYGIWSTGYDGTLQLLATVGETAPGLGSETYGTLKDITMSDEGLVAFMASIKDGSTTVGDALFVQDSTGTVNLVAAVGEVVDEHPGVQATISAIQFYDPGNYPLDQYFGDTLAYRLTFTDNNTGIYTASVPEPSTLPWLLTPAGIILCRRRRWSTPCRA